ncbi:MAG: glycosyltransferase family 4 protein [Verrucomicrobiota bacterium]|nr:glycosyltransferase family 4 protein [Verrucomicrobiota bacterium]
MKISFFSHFFSPSIGGIEQVSLVLAQEFVRQGHSVEVMTTTMAPDSISHPFPVHRRPSAGAVMKIVRNSDLVFHNNVGLNYAWPLLVQKKPWVVAHHVWITRPDGSISGKDRLKKQVLKCATNTAVSHALAERLPFSCRIIPNPYNNSVFRKISGIQRDKDIIFLGRLVSDKGVDLLIEAVSSMMTQFPDLTVSIVGSGPELATLQGMVQEKKLTSVVQFAGSLSGDNLTSMLHRHRVIAVPSRWDEPFGLVALEGIACGCVPVIPDSGGLPEAAGPCGLKFRHRSAEDLSRCLTEALSSESLRAKCLQQAPAHLEKHTPEKIAAQYLELFTSLVSRN